MKGSVFARTLPETAGERREQMILDAVRRKDIPPIAWVPITTNFTAGGRSYKATIMVSRDAVRVGDATDSFRVTVNHRTAQHIADELGVVLPTALLSDHIYAQAALQLPTSAQTRPWHADNTMSKTHRMLEQSRRVDDLIAVAQTKAGGPGLTADVGKDWITGRALWTPFVPSPRCGEAGKERAMNYGWHLKTGYSPSTIAGIRVIQPAARCHFIGHTDYSQVVRLVRRDVNVCGPGMGSTGCALFDIRAVASDEALYGLVNHDGVLSAMRHPDVDPSCDKRCPPPVEPPPPVPGVNGDPPIPTAPRGGPISCPTGCKELPPPEPDPTTVLVAQAGGMSAGSKIALFAVGTAAGYALIRWGLPRLSSPTVR